MKDLFGEEVKLRDLPVSNPEKTSGGGQKRPKPKKKGYGGIPGTGPAGETCRSCQNCVSVGHHDKTYSKCLLIKHVWTHGPGTDILQKTAACSRWVRKEGK